MMTGVFIETARLILRTVTLADVDAVARSWKLGEGPISRVEAERQIHWMRANHAQNTPGKLRHFCLTIIHKDTGEFIGWCGLDHLDATKPDPALFYLLKANHWGQGLATEAAKALLAYAFGPMDLTSIHGGAAPENVASKRVMEKIGMRFMGISEDGGYIFRMTREDYWRHNE
jgi:RimJ/RimL family protein N-acetyltransferase